MTPDRPTYRIDETTLTVDADDYMREYRDVDRFIKLCQECPGYNHSWVCPPFDYSVDDLLERYNRVMLIATRIYPDDTTRPISSVNDILMPERRRLDTLLSRLETEHDGLALAYAGQCLHCPVGSCTRPATLPCRYPRLARPSLEAYGFDVEATVSRLFGFNLLWSTDGHLPRYLTLASALFHSTPC